MEGGYILQLHYILLSFTSSLCFQHPPISMLKVPSEDFFGAMFLALSSIMILFNLCHFPVKSLPVLFSFLSFSVHSFYVSLNLLDFPFKSFLVPFGFHTFSMPD